jgi:hypothetical protein
MLSDTLNPFVELTMIEGYYKTTLADSGIDEWDFVFPFKYTETDKDVCYSTVIKTDTVDMHVYHEKLHRVYDRYTVVQDSLYSLAIYDSSKVIYVYHPEPVYKHLLSIDLFRPELYEGQVKDYTVYDSTGLRVIKFRFNNESPFISYRIIYHPNDYSLVKLEYLLKKDVIEPGLPYFEPPTYLKIEWTALGLTQDHVATDPELFSTKRYVKWQQGKLIPTTAYADYEIINTINPQ